MRINYIKLLLSGMWFKRLRGGRYMFYYIFPFRKRTVKIKWSKDVK